MRSTSSWMILLGDATWNVARINSDGNVCSAAEPLDRNRLSDIADTIGDTFDEQGYSGEPVLMALGSCWCVSATVAVPSARQARQRQAMAYLLEPSLPWAAEEIVADYEFTGTKAFAVVTRLEPLAELVQALETRGIRVQSIAPLSRLALAQHLTDFPDSGERYALVWGDEETAEVWLVDHSRPTSWQWVPHNAFAVTQTLRQIALTEPNSLHVFGRNLHPEVTQGLSSATDFVWKELSHVPAHDLPEAGLREATIVLEGRRQAAIEFRRDALATKDRYRSLSSPVRTLQVAVLVLLAAIGITFFVRAEKFDAFRLSQGDRQPEIFRRVFPDVPVPVGVRSRLENEYARLQGLRGKENDQPQSIEAVVVVERLLKSLPADLRFRVLEVRIENGRLYMVGQVREHSEADRIADGLRKAALEVDAPSTNMLPEKGVEFRISARVPVDPTETKVAQGPR